MIARKEIKILDECVNDQENLVLFPELTTPSPVSGFALTGSTPP